VLNVEPDDQFDDLFPGSGAITAAHHGWLEAKGKRQAQLFGVTA